MIATFTCSEGIAAEMQLDLSRSHPFAAERVGFLTVCSNMSRAADCLIVAKKWISVADEDYVRARHVGACIGPAAFRKVLEYAYFSDVGIFHVHRHDHCGVPRFSRVDLMSMRDFIPSFFNARPHQVHGAIVLSLNSSAGVFRAQRDGPDLPIANWFVPQMYEARCPK